MNNRLTPESLLTLLLSGLLGCGLLWLIGRKVDSDPKPAPPPAPVAWQAATYEEAVALAKASNRNMVVYYGATWCVPCKRMQGTLSDARVQARMAAAFVFVKIDGDKRRDLVKQFKVQAYPTYHVCQPSGFVLRSGSGFKSADDFLSWLGAGQADANKEGDL